MPTYSLNLTVTTDRTFGIEDRTPRELATRWARAVGTRGGLASSSHGPGGEIGVLGCVDCAPDEVPDRVAAATRTLRTVLAAAGLRILAWSVVESQSMEQIEQRLRNTAFPDLVDAGRFAEMCGVSRSRIHGLAAASRRTREDGRHHPFPPSVVPGYWLRSSAEAFARRRRTRPGPSRKTGTERLLDQIMARRKAEREGRPLPDLDLTLLPSSLEQSLEENGYTPEEARAMLSG